MTNHETNKNKKVTFRYVLYKGDKYRVSSDGATIYRGSRLMARYVVGSYFHVFGWPKRIPCYLLVALAFHNKTRKPGLIVHHKDHNKLNDHYKNLEWVTRSKNTQLAYEAGRIKFRTSPLSKEQIADIKMNPKDAMDKYNITHTRLYKILGKKIICR